jgi:hypothetical protein
LRSVPKEYANGAFLQHGERLRDLETIKELSQQLESVKEELEIIVKYTEDLRGAVLSAIVFGSPGYAAEIPRLTKFRDRYEYSNRRKVFKRKCFSP